MEDIDSTSSATAQLKWCTEICQLFVFLTSKSTMENGIPTRIDFYEYLQHLWQFLTRLQPLLAKHPEPVCMMNNVVEQLYLSDDSKYHITSPLFGVSIMKMIKAQEADQVSRSSVSYLKINDTIMQKILFKIEQEFDKNSPNAMAEYTIIQSMLKSLITASDNDQDSSTSNYTYPLELRWQAMMDQFTSLPSTKITNGLRDPEDDIKQVNEEGNEGDISLLFQCGHHLMGDKLKPMLISLLVQLNGSQSLNDEATNFDSLSSSFSDSAITFLKPYEPIIELLENDGEINDEIILPSVYNNLTATLDCPRCAMNNQMTSS